MTRAWLTAGISLVVMSVAAPSHAATLDLCIRRAWDHNPALKAEELSVELAGADVALAKTSFFPTLRLLGKYTLVDKEDRIVFQQNAFAPGIPPSDSAVATGRKDFYSLSLVLDQPLFTGWKTTAAFNRSREMKGASNELFLRKKRVIALAVAQAYNQLTVEKLNLDTESALLTVKQERLRVAKVRHGEGYLRRDEIVRLEADVAWAEHEKFRTEQRAALANSLLVKLMGGDEGEVVQPQGGPRFLTTTLLLKEAETFASGNREDLKSVDSRLRAEDEAIKVERSGFFPQVSLRGSYTAQKETSITRPEQWMVAALMDWPLFEWGRTGTKVGRSVVEKQKISFERDELRRDILLEVERVWRGVKERENAVVALEKALVAAESELDATLEKYAEGERTLAEVLAAEAAFIKSHHEYTASLRALDSARAELEAAVSADLAPYSRESLVYRPDIEHLLSRVRSAVAPGKEGKGKTGSLEVGEIREGGEVAPTFEGTDQAVKLLEDLVQRM